MTLTGFAFWLYGSTARGDADPTSDYDVLALGSEPVPDSLRAHDRLSVSRYQLDELEAMAAYGSLFLHHVKLEGRPLLETGPAARRFNDLLRNLGPYARVQSDLQSFRQALEDVKHSIVGSCSPVFEASSLAMVVRHASILGNYVLDCPRFGREEPILMLGARLELEPHCVDALVQIQPYRRHEAGREEAPVAPSVGQVAYWVDQAEEFLSALERRV